MTVQSNEVYILYIYLFIYIYIYLESQAERGGSEKGANTRRIGRCMFRRLVRLIRGRRYYTVEGEESGIGKEG